MADEPHVISKMFLPGGIVRDGELSRADRSYVCTTTQLLRELNIPMSAALSFAAENTPESDDAIEDIPYDVANISAQYGGRDYLKLPDEERDLVILCNIPTERREEINSLEDLRAHREWHKAQSEAGLSENHILSDLHCAKSWREKIDHDRPYIVAFHGAADTLRAEQLQTKDYIVLYPPQLQQGLLIDRHYLNDLYFGLAKIWAEEKKMPALIPVIQSLEKAPARTVFDWDYNQRRFTAQSPQSGFHLNF